MIGHVDAGKSTLMGHLLYLLGYVNDKTMKKYEKESKIQGKNTFHFAWAMDEGTEERKRGVTVDIAYKNIETKKFKITIMDAPGHKDFIPNMITGAAQADCALLIIDSLKNAFETGFFHGGQTREHAILAKAIGVQQLIVVVNKITRDPHCIDRFNFIKANLEGFLSEIGYKKGSVSYVPVSGLTGINLIQRDDKESNGIAQWYDGMSLLETIDSFQIPETLNEAPVRFIISDCGTGVVGKLQGFYIYGKVEGGVIFKKSQYIIMPVGHKATVRAINFQGNDVEYLMAGQSAEILLNIDETHSNEIG